MSETQQIGIGNLQEALSRYTRQVIISNWMVASGSDLSTIVPAYVNPAAATIDVTGQTATDLVGARIEFIDGANVGSIRELTGVQDNGTMSLDSPLPNAPSAGDHFVLLQGPRINVNVTAPEDIKTVNGTAQTGADWTALFQGIEANTGTSPEPAPPINDVFINGLSVAAETDILTNNISPQQEGALRIRILVSASAVFNVLESPNTVPTTGSSSPTSGALNSGNALSAGVWYGFDFTVTKQASYNFQVGSACDVSLLVQFSQAQ